ncbi:MAG: hypothetical protein Q7J35_03185 [Candidatus Methanoperedens sp.]|nr:hypothetical protein [Candidatus Methanoperedens sp.]
MKDVIIIGGSPGRKPARKRLSTCTACKGSGKCQNCHGTGKIPATLVELYDKPCRLCGGTGKCHVCKGKGKI